jgi:hypothetical protein
LRKAVEFLRSDRLRYPLIWKALSPRGEVGAQLIPGNDDYIEGSQRDMLTFSGRVQAYIDTLEWEEGQGLTPQERQEAAKGRLLVEGIVSEAINSRETLTELVEAINPHETLTDSGLKDLVFGPRQKAAEFLRSETLR